MGHQTLIVKALEQTHKRDQSGKDRHHPGISKAKSRGSQTLFVSRRSAHLFKGEHIRGRSCINSFGFTQSPVGIFANSPQGIPVLVTHESADPKITAITDDGFSS